MILYTLGRQALVLEPGVPSGLDAAVAVADAGISEVEEYLEEAGDAVERQNLMRALHMLNFNLAADLADCWPDDEVPREQRHFERGLRAAESLLGPLFQGAVAPDVLANDHWVKGMHLLCLGRPEEAFRAWTDAAACAAEAATRAGLPATGPDSSLQFLLLSGYLGIALAARGGQEGKVGRTLLTTALGYLRQRRRRPEEAAEAGYFIGQLEKVSAKHMGSPGPV
ncbi:MAG TPA: hypothetical protein VNN10_01670 [Dehalococcoidia bacterium]|nr:hypothetical protein [Dehalococcoidia bacterium]